MSSIFARFPPSAPIWRTTARVRAIDPECFNESLTDSLRLDGPQDMPAAPLATRSRVFTENARRERKRTSAPKVKRITIKANDCCDPVYHKLDVRLLSRAGEDCVWNAQSILFNKTTKRTKRNA